MLSWGHRGTVPVFGVVRRGESVGQSAFAHAGGEQRRGVVEAKSRLEMGAVSVNNVWGFR